MILREELYFEITFNGSMEELEKFEAYAKSGELSDFFDIEDDYFIYDDDDGAPKLIFTNDEYGIEIGRLDTEDFLDVLLAGARELDVTGSIYDIDDDEFRFVSHAGRTDYIDVDNMTDFNDEFDTMAKEEELVGDEGDTEE